MFVKKKKMNSKVSFILLMVIITFTLIGCGKKELVEERPVQVIDDNYRNYYEVFVYSFYDSNGDGIGDINGVTQKLDYISDLGFNGIWLMPVMPSPTYHKYDVTDYYDIDSGYGTMDDFEKMIEECHKRNINVVIDFVINHTSSKHPWFVEAAKYLEGLDENEEPDVTVCPYVDYYEFTTEQKDSTYYQVGNSSWYYEGSFWSEMPDLNLNSELVRSEIEKIADFWMEKGVDGFRMDAALHYKEKDTGFNTEVLNWLYDYCKEKNDNFYMVSEVWSNVTTIEEYYQSKTPSFFNFDLANAEGKIVKAARGKYSAEKLVNAMQDYQNDFGEKNSEYIDAPFISNHDTNRIANLLQSHADEMKYATGLLMTMNGSTFVYYGEEIGMPSSGKKDENKRLPMIWSTTDVTGLTKGPQDADQGIESKFGSVEEQEKEDTSLLSYYKHALKLRNENPELARGTIEIVDSLTNGNQAVITKTWNGSKIAVVYNSEKEPARIALTNTELEKMQICGILSEDEAGVTLKNGVLTVSGMSIVLLHDKE